MKKIIALVSCVKEKHSKTCAAKNLYKGPLFTKWMTHAKKYTQEIYILSGKHGLLKLDQEIEPYDVNLNDATPEEQIKWSQLVIQQLQSVCDIDQSHFLVMTSPIYYQYLLQKMNTYEIPFEIV